MQRILIYRSNKDAQRKVYETAALNVNRYSLFKKKQLEGEKLPPTKNAFKYHLSLAHFQLSIWTKLHLLGIVQAAIVVVQVTESIVKIIVTVAKVFARELMDLP